MGCGGGVPHPRARRPRRARSAHGGRWRPSGRPRPGRPRPGPRCPLDLRGRRRRIRPAKRPGRGGLRSGEVGRDREGAALERWWEATLGELVLVEPGTPAGFERLRTARTLLVGWGAHVTAPCPHDGVCPMTGSDWCHFAVRLGRSPLHRDVKGGRLGYEDEKYSFLAVSAVRPVASAPRLLRSPRSHKGHVRVRLCETDGLHERVISRRDGELYKRARAARWGDRLDRR